ncbi:MAG: DNA primase, partial [Desulfurococcaceae archaeon]
MPARINYRNYPFLASKREFPKLFIEKPSVLVSINEELRKKTLEVLKDAVEKGEIPIEILSDQEESVLVYYTILDIVKYINDKRIANRIALAYSKTASKIMDKEKNEALVAIANKLGLSVKFNTKGFPRIPWITGEKQNAKITFTTCQFSLPIKDYLLIVSQRLLHDPSYALVNHVVSGGYVHLDRNTFKRLLEEYIYFNIMLRINEAEPPDNPDFISLVDSVKPIIASYYEKIIEKTMIHGEIDARKEDLIVSDKLIMDDLFPPCIKKIIDSINSGGNPSHVERFNLAAFMGHIGLDVDEILEYFKKTPDYNERIARYQIEHILGIRGSRKKYKPYNCENLKAYNLCPLHEQCP